MVRLCVGLVAALGAAGCGLIDSDVTEFRLSLPEAQFTVDSSSWGLQGQGMFPSVDCPMVDCAGMAAMFCSDPEQCAPSCGTDGKCQVSTQISLFRTIDMAMQKPELATIDEQNGISVVIDEILFRIDMNSLQVALPGLPVYAGPVQATDTTHAEAHMIGTIASVGAMQTGAGMLEWSSDGKARLQEYMSSYTVPFNLIIGGAVVVGADDPIPMGRMDGVVTGEAHAEAL